MTGRRFHAAGLALALLCGASSTREERALTLRVAVDSSEVELGRAFPLRVVRAWDRALEPEPFDEGTLEPLALRLLDVTERRDGRRVEQTRHYHAYAFRTGALTVPAPSASARAADGSRHEVRGEALVLHVASALAPGNPGPVELPGGMLPEPRARFSWLVAALAAVLALGAAFLLRRRAAPEPELESARAPVASGVAAHERALGRIAALRCAHPREREETLAFHVEAAALLRDYLAERFALPAPQRTSAELLVEVEAARALSPAQRAALAEHLARCDLVKFALAEPGASERERLLERAEELLCATAAAREGGAP